MEYDIVNDVVIIDDVVGALDVVAAGYACYCNSVKHL